MENSPDILTGILDEFDVDVWNPTPKSAKSSGLLAHEPTYQNKGVPLADGESLLHEQVSAFFKAVPDFGSRTRDAEITGKTIMPPAYCIQATPGAGKTRATALAVRAFLESDDAGRGDTKRIAIAAPTIALAEQMAASLKRFGVGSVAVFRGRGQPDPKSKTDDLMCQDIEAVNLALRATDSVEKACCKLPAKNGMEAKQCPFYEACAYQRQKRKRPTVWIFAHKLLVGGGDLPDFDALIIDETFYTTVAPDKPDHHRWETFTNPGVALNQKAQSDLGLENDLVTARAPLSRAFASNGAGPLLRSVLDDSGITTEQCLNARQIEFMRKSAADMWPGMPLKARKTAAKKVAGNDGVLKAARLWKAVADFLADTDATASGRVQLVLENTKDGPALHIETRFLKTLPSKWEIPILALDATMPDQRIMEAIFPEHDLTVQSMIDIAHGDAVTVTQVLDAPVSSTKLGLTDQGKARRQSGNRNTKRIARTIALTAAAHHPARVGVIAQKEAVERLQETDLLPDNVEFAHFNALRGLNHFEDIRALFVIGRTLPMPSVCETKAGTLSGRHVENKIVGTKNDNGNVSFAFPLVSAGISTPDGGVWVDVPKHPDPLSEAVRWSICEAEVLQAIGRGRAIRRTDKTPLDIIVVSNLVLPITVDEVWRFDDVDPGPDGMMAKGGIIIENPRHAAQILPEYWPSENHAKADFRACSRLGKKAYRKTSIYKQNYPTSGQYKIARKGAKFCGFSYFPALISDPQKFLEKSLNCDVELDVESVAPPISNHIKTPVPEPEPDPPPDDDAQALNEAPEPPCANGSDNAQTPPMRNAQAPPKAGKRLDRGKLNRRLQNRRKASRESTEAAMHVRESDGVQPFLDKSSGALLGRSQRHSSLRRRSWF